MKTIKRTLGLILSMTLIIVLSQGCKKYEEGPSISLRSRAARVANTWKVVKYLKNGEDETEKKYSSTGDKRNYTETFTKDGAYSYIYYNDNGDAKSGASNWGFQNKDYEINRSGVSGQSSDILTILKLNEKEFWYYYMDGGDKKEFHLIPNFN